MHNEKRRGGGGAVYGELATMRKKDEEEMRKTRANRYKWRKYMWLGVELIQKEHDERKRSM